MMRITTHRPLHRGASLLETIAALAAIAVAAACTVPVLSHVGSQSRTIVSEGNLMTIGAAHFVYAADWNGRQVTWIVDDISTYGDDITSAFASYNAQQGFHPAVVLGWGMDPSGGGVGLYQYHMSHSTNATLAVPMAFDGPYEAFGAFRNSNARPLHGYLDGRVYSPLFFPPNDRVVLDAVGPVLDDPDEYVPDLPGSTFGQAWAAYAMSPAAMFDPAVMRAPSAGGWQNPWSLDDGFTSPGLAEAMYPALKTFVLEHHWNQNNPLLDPCNPGFEPGTYLGCEPYYFNHAFDSAPVTLFYDLSVRLFPNTEAIAADETIMQQTGDGLWSRDTPLGANGYFNAFSYDNVDTAHHVLTTDGIHGRDTIEGAGTAGARPGRPRTALDARRPGTVRRAPGSGLRPGTE